MFEIKLSIYKLGLTSTEVATFLSNQNFLKSRGQKDMLQIFCKEPPDQAFNKGMVPNLY